MAAEHPDTFELPSAADLDGIVPGSVVRAMFELVDIADVARMWAVVTGRDGDAVTCLLDNQPYASHTSLELFDPLRLPVSHLIAVDPPRPELAEHLAFVRQMAAEDTRPAGSATPVAPTAPPRVRGDQQSRSPRAARI